MSHHRKATLSENTHSSQGMIARRLSQAYYKMQFDIHMHLLVTCTGDAQHDDGHLLYIHRHVHLGLVMQLEGHGQSLQVQHTLAVPRDIIQLVCAHPLSLLCTEEREHAVSKIHFLTVGGYLHARKISHLAL